MTERCRPLSDFNNDFRLYNNYLKNSRCIPEGEYTRKEYEAKTQPFSENYIPSWYRTPPEHRIMTVEQLKEFQEQEKIRRQEAQNLAGTRAKQARIEAHYDSIISAGDAKISELQSAASNEDIAANNVAYEILRKQEALIKEANPLDLQNPKYIKRQAELLDKYEQKLKEEYEAGKKIRDAKLENDILNVRAETDRQVNEEFDLHTKTAAMMEQEQRDSLRFSEDLADQYSEGGARFDTSVGLTQAAEELAISGDYKAAADFQQAAEIARFGEEAVDMAYAFAGEGASLDAQAIRAEAQSAEARRLAKEASVSRKELEDFKKSQGAIGSEMTDDIALAKMRSARANSPEARELQEKAAGAEKKAAGAKYRARKARQKLAAEKAEREKNAADRKEALSSDPVVLRQGLEVLDAQIESIANDETLSDADRTASLLQLQENRRKNLEVLDRQIAGSNVSDKQASDLREKSQNLEFEINNLREIKAEMKADDPDLASLNESIKKLEQRRDAADTILNRREYVQREAMNQKQGDDRFADQRIEYDQATGKFTAVSNVPPGYSEKQLAEQSDEEIAQRLRNEQEYLATKNEEIEQIDTEILQALSEGNDELASALREKRNQSLADQRTSELELEAIQSEVNSDRRKELQKLQEAQQEAERANIEFVEGEDLLQEDSELDGLTCTSKQIREKLNKDLSADKLPYISPEDRFYAEHPLLAGKKRSSIGFVTFQHIPTGAYSAFAAFVTSFSDNYNLKWNNEEVYGRMDPIPTYSGTARKMNLNITIPSDSYTHAWRNMQNISMLIQSLYPSYDGGSRFSTTRIAASPLMKISWGNLINSPRGERTGVLATINSLQMTPKVEAGYFEWGSDPEREAQQIIGGQCQNAFLIPKEISISLDFGVLQDIALGWRNLGKIKSLDKTNRYYKFPYNVQTYQKRKGNEDKSLFDKSEFSKDVDGSGDPSQRDLRTIAKCRQELASNEPNPNVNYDRASYMKIVNENIRITQTCREILGTERLKNMSDAQLMSALKRGDINTYSNYEPGNFDNIA